MLKILLVTVLLMPFGRCFWHPTLSHPRSWSSPSDSMTRNYLQRNKFQDHAQSKPVPWFSDPSRVPPIQPKSPIHKSSFSIWSRSQGLISPHMNSKTSRPVPPQSLFLASPPAGVMEVLPKAISRVLSTYGRSPSVTSTTTAKPPVIWFPNQSEDCEQDSGGGGFSTFSLLALVMSLTNLVGILASNANNNINNNNNDNNVNNNNVQDANENNANNNGNVFTMVTFGGGKRRRKRNLETKHTEEKFMNGDTWSEEYRGGMDNNDTIGDNCWLDDDDEVTAEEVAAVVSLTFLRAYVQAALSDDPGCLCRCLCSANADAVEWGDIAHALAEALSVAHSEWVSKRFPRLNAAILLEAGTAGRSSMGNRRYCYNRYQCPVETQVLLDDDEAVTGTLVRFADLNSAVRL